MEKERIQRWMPDDARQYVRVEAWGRACFLGHGWRRRCWNGSALTVARFARVSLGKFKHVIVFLLASTASALDIPYATVVGVGTKEGVGL